MFKFKISESLLLIGIVLIGLLLRVFYLDQPMRLDESSTFLNYVNKHWSQVFNYTAPNNQVLNTLLIKLSTKLWGGHPFVIRLPALAFGVACIPLIYLVCKKLGSGGYIAALILAVHPYCILFSTNARGYSAIIFFTLLFFVPRVKFIDFIQKCF
jgi:4-amino-4-deoxy-L-arabinose transferase-like glycosyltransferase